MAEDEVMDETGAALVKRIQKRDQSGTLQPTMTVMLRYNDEDEVPDKVQRRWLTFKTRPHIPLVTNCDRCQGYTQHTTHGYDVISKSAAIELLWVVRERIRIIQPTPCKPTSEGAKRYPNRSRDDDRSRLTIDESRTNHNTNEIVEMAARLFNVSGSPI